MKRRCRWAAKAVQDPLEGQDPHVEPGRELRRTGGQVAVRKEQVRDDRLGPGRAGLVGGRDDDVVFARLEVVPSRAVAVMALIDAGSFGQLRHRIPLGTPVTLTVEGRPNLSQDASAPKRGRRAARSGIERCGVDFRIFSGEDDLEGQQKGVEQRDESRRQDAGQRDRVGEADRGATAVRSGSTPSPGSRGSRCPGRSGC